MRILMVNKFLYPRGGAESYMLKLGQQLEKSGHTVEYFGMYDEKNTVGNSAGLYTQNMDFHSGKLSRFLYPFKIIYSAEAYKKISRVIDSFKPDVVHMNNINFQLTPSVIYAVKKKKIPLVQTVHDYQMICPNHLLYNFKQNRSCTLCVGRNKLGCLKYKCIHSSAVKSLIGIIESRLYTALGTYGLPDLYICPSRFLENKLLCADKRFDGKVCTLHNFITVTEPTEPVKAEQPYIIFAGRFSEEKGISLLAETAKLLPEYRFYAAGSGPDEEKLHGIENIKLTGFLTKDELSNTVAGAKALIAPSVCFENCPLSILEAHSMGVPVITMNYGGMAELVEDGVTGILAKEATPQAIADAVKELVGNSEKYEKIRQNCIARKGEIMSAEQYANILIQKYGELIRRAK